MKNENENENGDLYLKKKPTKQQHHPPIYPVFSDQKFYIHTYIASGASTLSFSFFFFLFLDAWMLGCLAIYISIY